MRGRLVVLCGRSYSGKSTVAAALAERLRGVVIGLDAINQERGLQSGEGIPLEEWGRTHEIAVERVVADLERSRTAIVDDTSSPRFLRDGWRMLAERNDVSFALVLVEVDDETIHARQRANRTAATRHDVTDAVLGEHLDAFEVPGEDEEPIRLDGVHPDLDAVVAAILGR